MKCTLACTPPPWQLLHNARGPPDLSISWRWIWSEWMDEWSVAQKRRLGLERNDRPAVLWGAALGACQGNAKRRPGLRHRPQHPRTSPPRLPAAPPRPACASRRRRPSCTRSAPRTAFPPLPSANDCFRVQKPPVRAAALRSQFRAQTPPPEAGRGRRGPAPRQGGPRPLSAGGPKPDP